MASPISSVRDRSKFAPTPDKYKHIKSKVISLIKKKQNSNVRKPKQKKLELKEQDLKLLGKSTSGFSNVWSLSHKLSISIEMISKNASVMVNRQHSISTDSDHSNTEKRRQNVVMQLPAKRVNNFTQLLSK